MSDLVKPGVCRHCRCTEENPRTLPSGDACFMSSGRTVCSHPECIVAEEMRIRAARAAIAAKRAPRLRSSDVNRLIRGKSRKRREA